MEEKIDLHYVTPEEAKEKYCIVASFERWCIGPRCMAWRWRMRAIILSAILIATPVAAKQSVLSCFSQENKDHLTILGTGTNDVKIQWNGGPFNFGITSFEDNRYLVVKQFGDKGTFQMVYDSTTGAAYGGTIFYNGKKGESTFICIWQ